jgi:hypothetical protein
VAQVAKHAFTPFALNNKNNHRGLSMKSRHIRLILLLLFILSGFCSLLYQVVWLRLAYASFGIITPIMSILISTFMIGLSVGSWAGGKWVGNCAF